MGRPQDEAHLKLPMDAVIWSLVRERKSLYSLGIGREGKFLPHEHH